VWALSVSLQVDHLVAGSKEPPSSGAVWIVVPAYNEGPRITATLSELTAAHMGSVVVVDDGSTDDTWSLATEQPVWVLRHLFNCGQGAALQTGIDFAVRQGAAIIVTFDADGQHRIENIQTLIEPIQQGAADVVLGSRFLGHADGMPAARRIVLKLGVLFTRFVSRVKVTDTHNGLRAFSRMAATRMRISQNRMAHASEILDQLRILGLRYVEVPVGIRYTAQSLAKGQSSWNALKIVGQFMLGRMLK